MSQAADQLRAVLERRYHIALLLMAFASMVAFGTSYYMTAVDIDRSHVFNLVSGQRILAQRIAFLTDALDHEADPARERFLRADLSEAVSEMRRAHDVLHGISEEGQRIRRFTMPLAEVFAAGPESFDRRVIRFLEDAQTISDTEPGSERWEQLEAMRRSVIDSSSVSILQTHGLMELILAADAARSNVRDRILHVSILFVMLGLLGLVTILIFRPMSQFIFKAFEEVEGARNSARIAEDQAVAANEAKGHFLQAASHELKTPLNAILGMTEAIRQHGDLGVNLELEQVTAAGDQLLTLLNTMLDIQRMAENKLVLENDSFNLANSIKGVVGRLATAARAKGLSFEDEIEIPRELSIQSDAQRLEQVLSCLIDNAIKFTNEGGVSVKAHVETEDGQGQLHISVSDTGQGIEEDRLPHIFEKFSATGSMLSRTGGLGMSLALCRQIITSMGGSIDVHSVVGKGTRFLIQMPVGELGEDFAANVSTPEPAEKAGDANDADGILDELEAVPSCAPFSVLIVDDNMANRMVAEALVKPLGGRATMAIDGRQAVERAMEKEFDVILMDISMPVMDGIQATHIIRSGAGPNTSTPIVALTAHVGPGEGGELLQKGFADVLGKPVRRDTMERCIQTFVRRTTRAGEAA